MIIEGGTNEESNLLALCNECHKRSNHDMCVGRIYVEINARGLISVREDDGEGGANLHGIGAN